MRGLAWRPASWERLSLAHCENTFCTTEERGWPLGIVIYPCLCWGMGQVDWFVSIGGLAADTLFFCLMAAVPVGLLRLRTTRLRGSDSEAPAGLDVL